MFLELSLGWKLLVCAVYKPPKLGYISEVFDMLIDLLPTYSYIVVIGDFNVDLSSTRIFPEKTQFLDLIRSVNLKLLQLQPTYHLPNSDTWLDLLMCNDINIVNNFGQIALSGISYHDLIYAELRLKVKKTVNKKVIIRDFKNVNMEILKRECEGLSWNELYESNSIDCKVEILASRLDLLFNKYVPERQINTKKNPCPWINNDLKLQMKERDRVYKNMLELKIHTYGRITGY